MMTSLRVKKQCHHALLMAATTLATDCNAVCSSDLEYEMYVCVAS